MFLPHKTLTAADNKLARKYIEESTKQQSSGGFPESASYGYFWWISSETGHSAFFAGGYGGQYIYVIPDLDLIVVMTGNVNISPEQLRNPRYLIPKFITPAVMETTKGNTTGD